MKDSSCLVVFSGGQDSTTCLLWALKKFNSVFAISFNYNQKHSIELKCAKRIINILNQKEEPNIGWLCENKISDHKILDISSISNIFDSTLVQDTLDKKNQNKKSTFVPGRNILFLSIAGAFAYQKKIHNVVAGVCQTDNNGYPDCRDVTIKSLQATLYLGMDYDIIIHTPLMWKSKAETIKLMKKLGGLELFKYTHTCYNGKRPACGTCSACEERLKGFQELGIKDPIKYRNREI